MQYVSEVTQKGNSSYSFTAQAEADARALALDQAGCTYCTYCTDCTDCTRCTRCTRCTDCTDCTRCTYCTYCTDCTGEIIQAGRPNGWPCYGWLKDGALFIHCGCQRKTYAEAVSYWTGKPDRTEVLAAVECIATVARFRGWPV